jgi:hypothetical protein
VPSRIAKGEKKVFEQRHLAKMLAGGLTAANVIVGNPMLSMRRVLQSIIDYHLDLEQSPDKFRVITRAVKLSRPRRKVRLR